MANKQEGRPVTLTAVARKAGVSVATVSYVLNGVQLNRIPPDTQTRVRAAAGDLGYVPNASARSLRAGRSHLVIAHMPGGMPMLQRAAVGLDQLGARLRESGYTLLVHSDDTLRGAAAAKHWSALRPAALLTMPGLLDDAGLEMMRQVGTVVIAVAQEADGTLPTLTLDDSRLGEVAVQHLIERGCRTIAALLPDKSRPGLRQRGQVRLAGARRAARASKAKGVRIRVVDMAFGSQAAAHVVAAWRKQGMPDGVFGFDDMYSGLLHGALLDAGVRIPEDIALVGADDQPLCEMLRPRLTSVSVDLDSLAQAFATPVLAALRGEWKSGTRGEAWGAVLKRRDT